MLCKFHKCLLLLARVDNKRRVSHGAIMSVASQRRSRLSRPFMPVNLFY